jgi:SAM-dependent methyltransferase
MMNPDQQIRVDLALIAGMVAPGARVLDIGCAEGTLIEHLFRNKQCDARGLELDMDTVTRAVGGGLPVMQGDADNDLATYPDGAFDYVILSRTLQAVEKPRASPYPADAAHRHACDRQFSEFRPLVAAPAIIVARPHADDAGLEPHVVRDTEHSPLHNPGFFRAVRDRWLSGGGLVGGG